MKVYHGTSAHYYPDILEDGLVPQGQRTHSFVTTDYNKAREYSSIWTGGLIREEQRSVELGEKDYFFMETHGIIITLDIPKKWLILDDYNLKSEPNQYKILEGIPSDYIVNIEEIRFDRYSDHIAEEEYQSNLIAARAKLIGVSQWGS